MRKLTYEEVKKYIESFGYKLLSKEYINNFTPLVLQCPEGHITNTLSFANFKNKGYRCSKCCGNIKFSYEQVKEYIEKHGYKLLSEEYENAQTKLFIECEKGHKYKVTFTSFKNKGHRCPYCAGNAKYTYQKVKDYIESFGYKLLSEEYIHSNKHILIKCPKGHEYKVTFNHFKNSGSRCTICNNISNGEQKIINYLNENDIKYIYDKPYFSNLIGIGGGLLRPDFIIEDGKIWIEYDGEFHFKRYYEEQYFKELQIHDKIKNEYAKKNGWKLIRIPYWELDNIEKILKEKLYG